MTRYHRDKRLDRLRRELHKRTRGQNHRITKDMFLNFVEVHPNFFYVHRGTRQHILQWIEEDRFEPTMQEWLPEINERNAGYFDQSPETSVEEEDHRKLVLLGLTSSKVGSVEPQAYGAVSLVPASRRLSLSYPPSSNVSGRSFDLSRCMDLPSLRPVPVTIIHVPHGTAPPEGLVRRFPALAGQCQEEVWLDDMSEAKRWMDRIHTWFAATAEELGPDDVLTRTLVELSSQLPSLADHVERAQVCVDHARTKHEDTQGRRARVSNSFFDLPSSQGGHEILGKRKRADRPMLHPAFALMRDESSRTTRKRALFEPIQTPVSDQSAPFGESLVRRSESTGEAGRSFSADWHSRDCEFDAEDFEEEEESPDAKRSRASHHFSESEDSEDYGPDPSNPVE